MIKRITPVAFAAAMGLATLATPASAQLQIFIGVTVGATTTVYTCSWSQACNTTNSTPGLITLNPSTVNGVTFGGEVAQSLGSPSNPSPLGYLNYLYSSVGVVANTNNQIAHINLVTADTGFTTGLQPVATWANLAGAGTFHLSVGSTFTMNWFVDPANGQGAGGSGSTPGNLIGSYTIPVVTLPVEAVAYTNTNSVNLTTPYSVTEQTLYTLRPGGTLLNRAQTIVLGVPETSTWTMMLAGFAAIGFAGYRSSRKRAAQSV